jgi:uncharacterized protein YlzI (FlbEa/FlbD family)
MIHLSLPDGAPIEMNPLHVFYIQKLSDEGCQIVSSGGASVIVAESMDQVQMQMARWTKYGSE